MSAQFPALVRALAKSHAHALDAATEAASIAACADGYRGPLWLMSGDLPNGGLEIRVCRSNVEMADYYALRAASLLPPFQILRQILITEEGAKLMIAAVVAEEGSEPSKASDRS